MMRKDNSGDVPSFFEVVERIGGRRVYRCKACKACSGLLRDGNELSVWVEEHRKSSLGCFENTLVA